MLRSLAKRLFGTRDSRAGSPLRAHPRFRLELETLESRIVPAVDLSTYGIYAPDTADAGTTVSVSTSIANFGNSPSGGFYVNYYASTDPTITASDTLLKSAYRPSINSYNLQSWSEAITLPATLSGTRYIGVIVDRYNLIAESNESNNAQADSSPMAIAAKQIDLDPYWIDAPNSADAGATIGVSTGIANYGNSPSGGFYVRYYASADPFITSSDAFLKTAYRSSISGNGYQQWTESITLPATLSGPRYIGVIVDPYNYIRESNETNNTQADGSLTAITAKQIDLDPYWIDAPDTAAVGTTLSVSTDIDNRGNSPSGGFYVRYYASTDPIITSSDTFLKTVYRPSIDGNNFQQWSESINLPATLTGTRYIGVIVDPYNYIQESNETNNAQAAGSPIVITTGLQGTIYENGQPNLVSIERFGNPTATIDPNRTTWLVIHGRASSRHSAPIYNLAAAIDGFRTDDQVLTLDWSSLADALGLSTNEEDWIPQVAAWAAPALRNHGFAGGKLNLVGHSWGSYVAAEIAARIPGGVNTIVALDPATNGLGAYNPNSINFANLASFTWAFHEEGNDIYGSEVTPPTAHESFVVRNSGHTLLVDLFGNMLWSNNLNQSTGISKHFSLATLLAHASGPWMENRYVALGVLNNPQGGLSAPYEAVITADWAGTHAVALKYFDESWGSEVTRSPW